VAERLNRTLVESACSMLLEANLTKYYRAEAVSTAVYLKYRCSTKAVQGMTPYEAWHGGKTGKAFFECLGVMHMPISLRTSVEFPATDVQIQMV